MNEHTALVIAVREALKQTSMRKLAVKAGVSHTTISAIIGGKSADVSLKTYQALMNATESNMRKPVTTHDHASASFEQVEQLAAQRVNADLTHHADWDTDLQCAKYRRVMRLEAEVLAWQGQHRAAKVQIDEVTTELECSRIDVRKAEALTQVYSKDLQVMQASWKAACVQAEQLQKQLDHGQAQFKSLHDAYNQQVDDESEMLAQIDTLFAERDNMRTEYEYSLMRLRVRCFALVCAIVLLIVSGLVVWGGV